MGPVILAGTDGNGIYSSTDNGTSWSVSNIGLTNMYVRSFTVNGFEIYAGTEYCVFKSSDYGRHWAAMNNGLSSNVIWSLAVAGNNIFAGTEYGIYKSSDNGNSWAAVNNGLIGNIVWALAVNGTKIFAGTNGGGVFLSTNDGTSWLPQNEGLSNLYVYSFVINGSNIYAGTSSGFVFTALLSQLTNILESQNNESLTISPNPTSSQTTISFSLVQTNAIIKVMDVTGMEIKNTALIINNQKAAIIDINGYSKGVYSLQITDANRNEINRKVVLQ